MLNAVRMGRTVHLAPPRVPGDWLLHPVPLVAIAVLGLNDRVWKAAYANDLTGKLSDVAGMLFFPWLLLALCELGRVHEAENAARRFRALAPESPLLSLLSNSCAHAALETE